MAIKNVTETDVLIIGAGMAGCRAAIGAADKNAKVTIVTKGLFGKDDAATWMPQVGFQCWGIHEHDTLDVQVEDTLRCGNFLNNQEMVYTLLALVPDAARELLNWGQRVTRKPDGSLQPAWQLGCSTKEGRSITPAVGLLGYQYSRIFPPQLRNRPNITIVEDTFMFDLLTTNNNDEVVGAIGIDRRSGEFRVFKAKSTVLATGGYQGVYPLNTSNPLRTGESQGMAFRIGADQMDFEFNQSLPVALHPQAMRGDLLPFDILFNGAHWYNTAGKRFMVDYDPDKMELSTRAIISRAIASEQAAGRVGPHGGVFTTLAHLPDQLIEDTYRLFERDFRWIRMRDAGIDLHKQYIETGYSIHYCQGGLSVNTKGETDKQRLYAIGEAAPGGKDGADRMMSNALPYCFAQGILTGDEVGEMATERDMPEINEAQVKALEDKATAVFDNPEGPRVYQELPPLQQIFMQKLEYGRNDTALKETIGVIEEAQKEILPKLYVPNKARRFNDEWLRTLECENLLLCAEAIARNALMRKESRGLHDRSDYPSIDPEWCKNIHIRRVDGKMEQWTTPVEWKYWKPEPGSLGEPTKRGVKVEGSKWEGYVSEPLWKKYAPRANSMGVLN